MKLGTRTMLLAAAALGVAVGAGTLAYAAIPNSDTAVISGCYEKRTGILRVIDVEAGRSCTQWETAISWNQKGAKGDAGAAGAQGERGPQGEPGPQGVAGPQGATGNAGATGSTGAAGPAGPQGETGDKGDKGDKGDPGTPGGGVRWRGTFDGISGGYAAGDLVRAAGGVWMALRDPFQCRFSGGLNICGLVAPGTDASTWQLFAQDGPKGDAGAQGPPGPAGANGVSGHEVVVSTDNVTTPEGFDAAANATCPQGKKLMGGGARLAGQHISSAILGTIYTEVALTRSFPVGDSWAAQAYEINSGFPHSWSLEVYAICAFA